MDKTCGDCRFRFFEHDALDYICANTFSKKCCKVVNKNDVACDCYEKPFSLDEILKEKDTWGNDDIANLESEVQCV